MAQIVEALAKDLEARGNLDLIECFIDGSFAPANFVSTLPTRLVEDKAYDSDPHDQILLDKYDIELTLIAPHRKNGKKAKTQDGRKLRPYKRHWKVERVFACIYSFRRIVVRYEHKLENYLAFVLLACIKILLRKF